MIFSVSDKGGLEEKKFCPIYISTAVPSHSFTRSLQAYPHIYKK